MYKSRFEIERKLKQIDFLFKDLKKFENRIFVNSGLHSETGCYPIEVRLGTFLIYCRSIFQYAHKEISSTRVNKTKYDAYINNDKIIKYFKDLRDSEIHSFAVTAHPEVIINSPIVKYDKETRVAESKQINFLVESLDDLESNSMRKQEVKIVHNITKRLEITSELLERFKIEGKHDLVEAANKGETLFESQDFNGTSDLFILCGNYLESIKSFVEYASKEKMIS